MADKGRRKPSKPKRKPESIPPVPSLEEPPSDLESHETPTGSPLPPLIQVEPDGLLHLPERKAGAPAFDELFPDDGEGDQPPPSPSVPLETVTAPTPEQPDVRAYGCKCGFMAQDAAALRAHFLVQGRKDGPGIHGSTRTAAKGGANRMPAAGRPVGNIREAARVRFIPKEFVLEASPILFQAMEVAANEWHWPAEMTPQDFLETYIYRTMKQLGYTLHGYVKNDEPGSEPASEDRGDANYQGRIPAHPGG